MKTTPQEFIYWLQGFFEIVNPTSLSPGQTATIKAKLESCFEKVTQTAAIPQEPKPQYCYKEESPLQLDLPVMKTGIIDSIYSSSWGITGEESNIVGVDEKGYAVYGKSPVSSRLVGVLPPNWTDKASYITC